MAVEFFFHLKKFLPSQYFLRVDADLCLTSPVTIYSC